MPGKVFVTGGHGFIGQAVVRALIDQGHAVRCLLRPSSKTLRIDHFAFQRVMGDVRELASLQAGMVGCDRVIHLASLSNWKDINSPRMHEVVVGGTANVLAAAKATGNLRTVFVSSSMAVDGSATPIVHTEESPATIVRRFRYPAAKAEAESLCRASASAGLPVTIVNPCEVYGPQDTSLITAGNLIDFAKSSPVLVCKGGTSVVYVDDVAAGIVAALDKGRPGERYILGGENLTVRRLAELTLEILGKKKKIVNIPNGLVRAVAKIGGALHLPLPFNPSIIPFATRYWFMDSSKAQRELGITFRSAHDTLVPTLGWLREAGHIA